MRTLAVAVVVLVQSTGVAVADPHKLTLEQVIAKALAGPRARTARSTARDRGGAARRGQGAAVPADQGDRVRHREPEDPLSRSRSAPRPIRRTSRSGFDGLFGGGQLEITQPLYTFGRASHARAAAKAGSRRSGARRRGGRRCRGRCRARVLGRQARARARLHARRRHRADRQGAASAWTSAPARTRRRCRIASASRCCSPTAKVQRADAAAGGAPGARRAARADRRGRCRRRRRAARPR